MVIAELEQLKEKLASLEASLTEYTKNISLPIKEAIQKDWAEAKALLKKFEEMQAPKKIEEPEKKTDPFRTKK
jgi:hypothetical protein